MFRVIGESSDSDGSDDTHVSREWRWRVSRVRALYRYDTAEHRPREEDVREWFRLRHLTGVPLVSIYVAKPSMSDTDELYGYNVNPDMICRKGWTYGARPVILPEATIASVLRSGYRDFTRCTVTLGFIPDYRYNDSPYASRLCTHYWLAREEGRMEDRDTPKCRIVYRRSMDSSKVDLLKRTHELPSPEELPHHTPMRLESQAWLAAFNHLQRLRESCVTLWCVRVMRAYEAALRALEKTCSLTEFVGCVTLATRDGVPRLKYREYRTSVVSMPRGVYGYLRALDDTWDRCTGDADVRDEEEAEKEGVSNSRYYDMESRTATHQNIRHIRCMAIFCGDDGETMICDSRAARDITVKLIGGDPDTLDKINNWDDLVTPE